MESLFLLRFYQKRNEYFKQNDENENNLHFVLTNNKCTDKIKYIIKLLNKVFNK